MANIANALEKDLEELRRHNKNLLLSIEGDKTVEHFRSPLNGAAYRKGINPKDVRYVLYIKSPFLREMVDLSRTFDDGEIANALFLGHIERTDGNTMGASFANKEIFYYYLGHRVWSIDVRDHLAKKLVRVAVAGNRDRPVKLPSTKEEMEDETLDWVKIFNHCWALAKFLPLKRDILPEEFKKNVIIWRFREFRNINGRLV